MFKKGDFVRHIKLGEIAKVREVLDCWEIFASNNTSFIKVRFLNLPKKYWGLYHINDFEPYTFPDINKSDENVLDWLSNPTEKLRKALEKKHEKVRRNSIGRGKIRMDGRKY